MLPEPADLALPATPLQKAVKQVLVDPGKPLFGRTESLVERVLQGGAIDDTETRRIGRLRGRVSLSNLLLGAVAVELATSNSKSFMVSYHKRGFGNIIYNDLWWAVEDDLAAELLALAKDFVSDDGSRGLSPDQKEAAAAVLVARPWGAHHSPTVAMAQETLWEEVLSTLGTDSFKRVARQAGRCTRQVYAQALALGGRDGLGENLQGLGEQMGKHATVVAAAHELVSLCALLAYGIQTDFDVLRARLPCSNANPEDWKRFCGHWEACAGLAPGSMGQAVAWLEGMGALGQALPSARVLLNDGSLLTERALTVLTNEYANTPELMAAIMEGSFSPVDLDGPGMERFSHMGADRDNLVAVGSSTHPVRVLVVGATGTGKSALARAVARARGRGAVAPQAQRASGATARATAPHEVLAALNLLQAQAQVLDFPTLVVDPMDALLEDKAGVERHLTSPQARAGMKTCEVWTLRGLKDVPVGALAGFDLIVHTRPLPLADKLALAGEHFEGELAHRVAQAATNAGEIVGAGAWARATGQDSWAAISARMASFQQASMACREASEDLPLQVASGQVLGEGFDSVVGDDRAVAQARQAISCLQDPQRFARLGGKAPGGVLLRGEPGMGKTHLARAMAVEASVPFLMADCAALARDPRQIAAVFSEAQRQAPCILFLDEVDAVGTHSRGRPGEGADPKRHGILNRLLMELDGVRGLDGVLVVGATHRSNLLDDALVRSGRLGWHIHLREPTLASRRAVWAHYAKGKTCQGVDFERVARMSCGMTPADIHEAMNFAAILAVQDGSDAISHGHLVAAVDQTLWHAGEIDLELVEEQRHRVAIHEAGHALMAWAGGIDIDRASVRPRHEALGHVRVMPEEGRPSLSRAGLAAQMAMALGGLTAETVCLGDHATGAGQDLAMVRQLARRAVRREGMCPELPAGVESGLVESASQATLAKAEALENTLVGQARQATLEWMGQHKELLETLAAKLLQEREMDGEEIARVLRRSLARGTEMGGPVAGLLANGWGMADGAPRSRGAKPAGMH